MGADEVKGGNDVGHVMYDCLMLCNHLICCLCDLWFFDGFYVFQTHLVFLILGPFVSSLVFVNLFGC
jgi:hypothetical protein